MSLKWKFFLLSREKADSFITVEVVVMLQRNKQEMQNFQICQHDERHDVFHQITLRFII